MGTARFRRSVLAGKYNVDRLFASGVHVPGPGVSLLVAKSDRNGSTRFVVCVSRKAGSAVRRNRVRRITRESLDAMIPDITNGHLVALFPGRNFSSLAPSERRAALGKVFRKACLIDPAIRDGGK